MAIYTENYNLILPEAEDIYNHKDYNTNFETLDAVLTSMENQIETFANTPSSVIKSIQYVTHKIPADAKESSCKISPVDPSKCIAIFERLEDTTTVAAAKIRYSLGESSISLSHDSRSSSYTIVIGFWIIEFN